MREEGAPLPRLVSQPLQSSYHEDSKCSRPSNTKESREGKRGQPGWGGQPAALRASGSVVEGASSPKGQAAKAAPSRRMPSGQAAAAGRHLSIRQCQESAHRPVPRHHHPGRGAAAELEHHVPLGAVVGSRQATAAHAPPWRLTGLCPATTTQGVAPRSTASRSAAMKARWGEPRPKACSVEMCRKWMGPGVGEVGAVGGQRLVSVVGGACPMEKCRIWMGPGGREAGREPLGPMGELGCRGLRFTAAATAERRAGSRQRRR